MTKNQKKERAIGEMIAGIGVFITIVFFLILGVLLAFAPNLISTTTQMQHTTFGGIWFGGGTIAETKEDIPYDAFIGGNKITVDSIIEKDLFVAGETVTIKDQVNGSLRAVASSVIVDGTVRENSLIIADSVWIKKDAQLENDLTIFANTVVLDGKIDGEMGVVAKTTRLSGLFLGGGNVQSDTLLIEKNSRFTENLTIDSNKNTIEEGVIGNEFILPTTKQSFLESENPGTFMNTWVQWNVGSFIFALLFGTICILIAPKTIGRVAHVMHTEKRTAWKNGILFFLAVPTALFLIAITIIGLPIAVLGTLLYFLLLGAGKLFTAVMIGLLLLRKDKETISDDAGTEKRILLQQFALGLIVLSIMSIIPLFGTMICALAAIWGVGAMVYVYRMWRYSEN